jgi:hypothetical protein
MNIKCPYCGCCYNIDNSLLQNPVGNEKLGYGWWLRCHRCNKKWWLHNSIVADELGPLKADKQEKIDKLSRLIKDKPKKISTPRSGWVTLPLILFLVGASACAIYFNRDVFYEYVIGKTNHILHSEASSVLLENVRYTLKEQSGNGVINVSGVIKNEGKVVVKLKGIRVSIFDGSVLVQSSDSPLQPDFILPDDNLDFSVDYQLAREIKDIRIEVSAI